MTELLIILYIAVGVYLIGCFCNITKKAGYSTWFGLLMIIPVVNLIALSVFAFKTWPISQSIIKQNRRLKELSEQEHTAICDKCGSAVSESDKFCSSCGVEFVKRKNVYPQCNRGEVMSSQISEEQIYEEAKLRVKAKRGFYGHLATWTIVNVVLIVVWALSNPGGYPWFLWPLCIWGIFVFVNYLRVFVFQQKSERAAIEKEAEKIKKEQG